MTDPIPRWTPPQRWPAALSMGAPLWWVFRRLLRTPQVRWILIFVACILTVAAAGWWRLPGALTLFVALTLLVGLAAPRRLGR